MKTTKEHPILFNGEMVRALLSGAKTQTRRVVKPQPISVEECTRITGSTYSLFGPRKDGKWSIAGPAGVVCDKSGLKNGYHWRCPYGVPGDRLWVRETWACGTHMGQLAKIPKELGPDMVVAWKENYHEGAPALTGIGWRPSIHMPRWASRITLKVTDVRVERVQDISAKDAIAEGVVIDYNSGSNPQRPENWGELSEKQQDEYIESQARATYMARLDDCERCVAEFHTLWDSINAKRGYGWATNPWVYAVTFKVVT